MTYVAPRACGKCTACCDGHLLGEAYGHKFGPGLPCHFLTESKCTIYETRPKACRDYYCAWAQGLFAEWMNPDNTGALISVEANNQGQQYLKVILMNYNISKEVIDELDVWARENDTYYVVIKPQHIRLRIIE